MNEAIVYPAIMVIMVFISSCTQILLKKSAETQYKNKLSEYLNKKVVGAYAIFGVVVAVNMYLLRFIPLSLAVVLDSFGYVFVPILSVAFLREKLNSRQILGIVLIIVGIVIFSRG